MLGKLESHRQNSHMAIAIPTPGFLGFPCGSVGKESTCNVGDLGSIPGLGRFPGKGKGYPLQYSVLENSRDCIVYGVTTEQLSLHFRQKNKTWLLSYTIHKN